MNTTASSPPVASSAIVLPDPVLGSVWEMEGKLYLVTLSIYYEKVKEWYVHMGERKRDTLGRLRRLPGKGYGNMTSGYFNVYRERATPVRQNA